ncbi:hypothetical protein EJ06DRAFT_579301 [Trichodelitschia bisporula]|uniref:BL00235/CARNS1 N-terminal domain-containing protein n=1 Tax=Trichodelitschia bisporula TaxID=703511 RepID=A0A6G1I8U5_9PEZI|nr:hypothetical protein EJ06DRAFT_579301 [Trichodelitschia bisporula]
MSKTWWTAFTAAFNEPKSLLFDSALASSPSTPSTAVLILPLTRGWTIRCDIVERRLKGCHLASQTFGFVEPLQCLPGLPHIHGVVVTPTLPALLTNTLGAAILAPDTSLSALDAELTARLPLPLLCPTPLGRKCLAWIESRSSALASIGIYAAAAALGISLIVLNNPGHWLEPDDGPYADMREPFVPVDIEADDGFVDRAVGAIRGYPEKVDGVMAVSDSRVEGVAQVAGVGGLTRYSEGGGAVSIRGVYELLGVLEKMQFPAVGKPAVGWGSECVTKVRDEAELRAAVEKASTWHRGNIDVLIELFVTGPEVAANLVMLDGEVLFAKAADDFPSPGDGEAAGFQKMANLLPPRLAGGGGSAGEGEARPPGYFESVATALTYGVDYYALQVLLLIGDEARYRALAQPSLTEPQ